MSFHLLQLLTLQENWHSEKEIKVIVFDRNAAMSLMAYVITEAMSNPNLLILSSVFFSSYHEIQVIRKIVVYHLE